MRAMAMRNASSVAAVHARRMFDGVSDTAVEDALVRISDGRITEIRAGVPEPPPGAVSFGDATILPGLIDIHVHLALDAGEDPLASLSAATDDALLVMMEHAGRRALAAGITTVRDLGDRGFLALRVRDRYTSGAALGPEILAAGPPLTSPRGHAWFLGGEVRGEAAVRAAVRRAADSGAHVIKMMASGGRMTAASDTQACQFSVREMAAAADEAHRAGLPMTVHAYATEAIARSLDAGVDGIEHCFFETLDGVRADAALIDRLARSRTAVCPTLGLVPDWPVPPGFARFLDRFRVIVTRMHEAGVLLVAGTDAGVLPGKPHDALPYCVVELSELGMTNAGALRSATSVAASVCRVAECKGRLAPGWDADILVVDGDPLSDISALTRVRRVLRAGVVVPAAGRS